MVLMLFLCEHAKQIATIIISMKTDISKPPEPASVNLLKPLIISSLDFKSFLFASVGLGTN